MLQKTYLQSSARDIDIENGLVTQEGRGRMGHIERVTLTGVHYRV